MLLRFQIAAVLFAGALAMPPVVRADPQSGAKAAEAANAAADKAKAAADVAADFAAKLEKAVAEAGKSDTANAVARGAATTAKVAAADALKAASAATAAAKAAVAEAVKAKAAEKAETAAKAAQAEAEKTEGDAKAASAAMDKAEAAVSAGLPTAPAASSAAVKAATRTAASAAVFATAAKAAEAAWTDADNTAAKPEKPATQVQIFSLPALHSSDSGDWLFWFALGTLVCLFFTVLLLALAGFRLNDVAASSTEALEGLSRSLLGLQGQAATAKQRYEEARTALANPPAPSPAPPTPRPEGPISGSISRSDIVKSWDPPRVDPISESIRRPEPTTGPISGSWLQPSLSQAAGLGVVGDYQRVRSSGDGREVDRFEASYHFIRISCINFDDLRTNPNASLRFQEAQRGSLLLVNEGSQTLAFPWFATDLVQERERLEGIFQYFDRGAANLRLTKPAVLDKQGANWVMREPGSVQADV